MLNYPRLLSLFSLFALWLAEQIGISLRRRGKLNDDDHADFGIVLGACLTLLGLILGFTFSMAVSRYDLRKNYEEAEANAIGTEYVRTGLLPAADAVALRAQLTKYLKLRISFYRGDGELRRVAADTTQLQTEMWSAVLAPSAAQPTPLMALAVSGMNDVLNSQGYTQAAWWNRIPTGAWSFLVAIAVCCSFLVGYGWRHPSAGLTLILPVVVSISLFLVADIDSPRGGFIHVTPENLLSLCASLAK